ncbi:MAG: NUDIX hydrolase [Planctomycetes bacterium]|nr:NUDIX hydrolase [Planctomycetota bacterium]
MSAAPGSNGTPSRSSDGVEVEVLEDRADRCGPRGGFLQLQRLLVRNLYPDGTSSEPYPCDVVSRRGVDAVTIALFEREADGRVIVGLRENLRVPIWLRRRKTDLPFPDDPPQGTVLETVAGILEPADRELGSLRAALRRRAALECEEEIGLPVPEDRILDLGGASFPTPGIGDEKVYFAAAEVRFAHAGSAHGDGSVMEEVGGLVLLELEEALARCRDGRIPDMKTEIALARLRDRLRAASSS